MTKKVLAAIALTVAGCRSPTAYRDSYRDVELGYRRFLIEVRVNSTSGTALEYLHRRAAELCPIGYDVVDQTSGEAVSYTKAYSTTVKHRRPEVSAVVQCHMDAVGPPGGE